LIDGAAIFVSSTMNRAQLRQSTLFVSLKNKLKHYSTDLL